MKRLVPAVLASALLAVPSGASGQLSSLCYNEGGRSTPLCFNATAYAYAMEANGGYSNHMEGYWSGWDRWFPPSPGYHWYVGVAGRGAGGVSEADHVLDPGTLREYTWNSDANESLSGYDVPVPDLSHFRFGNDQTLPPGDYGPGGTNPPAYYYANWIWCTEGRSDCVLTVSVPEPSTYLLMLTGMLGLGLVAYRRREDQPA